VLAQAKNDPGAVLFWGSVLIAAVGVLGLIAWAVRRRFLQDSGAGGGEIWSLQQLRDMRASGQISEAEFERLRAEMIGMHGLAERGISAGSSAAEADADEAGNGVKRAMDEGR
jgi:hypothetical protein